MARAPSSSSGGGWGALLSTRRAAAAPQLLLALLLSSLLLLASPASGSLMSIDLGAENLRAVLVKPSGRGNPLQIVVNEMSRRKSPALVGLAGEDRLLGEEALSFAIRYPTTVFSRVRDLLGRSAGDAFVQNMLKSNALPYEVVDHPERKTAMLKVNETTAYLAEELAAGVLQYAKQITDEQAGAPIVDAVITVPAWLGAAQRQALKDAAALAGLNVLALVNGHSAAALQYGIERDFAAKEQRVVLYDMGSGSTEVALVKYSTYLAKEPGSSKPKPVNQFEVLDADWDATLGSNDLDMLLADHFAKQFADKTGLGDVRTVPKAMAKLKRQVRRTKEVLSANSDAPLSVEELHEGRDFQATISRADFEAMAAAAGFWERAAAPLKRLLARNGLKGSDVDAVELLGGGSRVPRLQAALSEALGGRALDKHLDADEAVALGGALFAANLSTSFRLRKFGMTDVAMYGVSWASDDLDLSGSSEAEGAKAAVGPVVKNLLPAGKKLPIKRAVKFNNLTTDAFSFRLEYNASSPHGLPPGSEGRALIAEYAVAGIKDAVKRYNHSGVTALRFEADWSGLVALDKAECVVEAEVMVEETIEVPAEEGAGNATEAAAGAADGKKADAKADAKEEEKKDAEAAAGAKDDEKEAGKDGADKNGAAGDKDGDKKDGKKAEDGKAEADKDKAKEAEEPKKPKTVTKKVTVPRRKVFHVPLKVDGPRAPSSSSAAAAAPLSGALLAAAQANVTRFVRRELVKRETARAKNDLEGYIIATREALEGDDATAVTTEEQRSAFREALMDAEDWLYGDGEHEAAGGFKKRLAELRAVGDPIARRASELKARPEAVKAARAAAEAALKAIATWPEAKPWINETDAADAAKKVEEFSAWLAEQEAAQAKKAAHEDPAFDSLLVALKWDAAARPYERLAAKKKPRAPKAKAKANETDAGAGKDGAGKEGAAGGDADQQQQEQEEAAAGKDQQQQQQEKQQQAEGEAQQQQGSADGEQPSSDEPEQHEEL